MASRGRKNCDSALILALASGAAIPDAARHAQCSESTAYRGMQDASFRQKVAAMRQELVSRAVGKLSALGSISTDVLHGLLSSANEKIRLGAVRTTLEHMFRGTELESVIKEVEELKATVGRLTADKERE
jgi:hypothetical protein